MIKKKKVFQEVSMSRYYSTAVFGFQPFKNITFCEIVISYFLQIILTCLSETTLLGIAQEKFYNQAAVFTTSLANLGKGLLL